MYNSRDYAGVCALSKNIDYTETEQKKWLEEDIYIEINDEISVTDNAACFTFTSNENDKPQYLYIKKDANGWFADGLMKAEPLSQAGGN